MFLVPELPDPAAQEQANISDRSETGFQVSLGSSCKTLKQPEEMIC